MSFVNPYADFGSPCCEAVWETLPYRTPLESETTHTAWCWSCKGQFAVAVVDKGGGYREWVLV